MTKKTPLLVLLVLVFFVQTWAQTCGTPDNISQTQKDGSGLPTAQFAYSQTFTPDCSGVMKNFSVWHTNLQDVDVTVYLTQGPNPTASTILQSWSFTMPATSNVLPYPSEETTIDLPNTQNLTAGVVYGFVIVKDNQSSSMTLDYGSGNYYTGGEAFWVNTGTAIWQQIPLGDGTVGVTDIRFRIRWEDQSPYVTCRENRSFALGADGTVNISFSQMTAGSGASEGESMVILSVSPNFFDCDDIGPQNVSLTVQDSSGQNAFCSTTITITDGEDPVLTCPDDITVNTDPGVPAIVTYDAPTYSDCSPIGDFDGFTYLETRDNKFFYLSNSYERADLAFDQAEALGGHVATVIDEEHNNFIRSAVNNVFGDESVLIGFNDADTEGIFVWHDGDTSATYTNWGGSQPNQSSNRDYGYISGNGNWVTSVASARRPYILQLTEAPTTLTPISGLPSESVFPVGTTTNTFEVVDAFGNIGTCSFDVTVVQNPFETLVELDNGKLTITDVENDSDDQITLSSDGTTLTISDLVLATASGDGVVLTDFSTVTVPIANITNGIEFIAGNGANSINFSTDLSLTGSNNDIMLSGLGLGTDILDGFAFQNGGPITIGGDFTISNSPNAKIQIGELTAVNLNISDAFSIEDASSPLPITILGQTDIELSSFLELIGNSIHTFSGTVNLEATFINVSATGSLNLGSVTTTDGLGLLTNTINVFSGNITLTGDIVTAGDSNLLLRGDIINQSGGAITTDVLFLRGSASGETTAVFFGDNDVNTIEVPTGSTLEAIIFNDIDDLEIGRFTVEAATLFGTTINLTEATEIIKNGTGNLSILSSGAVNITNTDVGSPATITHNGGNIEFEGTNVLVEKLSYQGLTGTTTRFLGPTTFNNEDLSLEFGTLKIQAPVHIASSDIQIIDELLIDAADGVLSGAGRFIGGSTRVEQGGTIAPGNGTTPSTLIVRSVEFNDGTFAPYIDSDSAFDQLDVVGTVTLTNADFVPTGDFSMDSGTEEIVLINNNGTDAVVGTFNGFPEGSQVTLPGSIDMITISYTGGDGNDITLSKDLQAPVMTCPGDVTIDCADAAKVFAIGVGQNTPVDIPDNDDTGITSIANITGIDADLEVIEITVQTAINHSWIGDLYMDLTAPNGETVVLFAESLNENSNLNADFPIVFTDAATTPAIDIGNTISGFDAACEVDNICEYTAMEGVDAFAQLIAEINTNGSLFNGDWTLSLRDDIGDDTGNLVSWQLNITANDSDAVSGAVNSDPSATGFATAIDSCNLPDCTPTISYEDSVADGCGISEVITRTWTATDASGNSSSCVQTITITDTAPPIIDSCSDNIIFELAPGETEAIITYDLPTASDICGDVTVLQTEGLASGDAFPEGITTNTFSITDACGNETLCSFTVTVTLPETLVEFTGGKLTITDVDGGTSDDDLFLSNFASPLLTISNLTPPVEVLGDVTVIDETTVSIPYADITNGIEFVAADGVNKVTMSGAYILTGGTNDLKFDNLQEFNVISFINTEGDVEITGNGNLNLNIGPWTVQNLYVDNARIIQDQPSPGITVFGTTNLSASEEIAINDGEGIHEFNGPVSLEAGRITFTAGADLTFNDVAITATDGLENYLVASPGTLTLDGNINITERTTNLFLASNDGITQQSGIINECFLILRGDGSGNATLDGANTVAALAVTNPFNADESAFGNLSFTSAVDMFLANITVDEFTLTAPQFDLVPDFTIFTKNGTGVSNFNADMDINSGTIPARVIFNHNAGTINFNGTVNDFDGLLKYNGTNASITHFSGTTTVNPNITPNFGSLNSTGTFIARSGVIGILNEARFSGSSSVLKGEAFLSSGPTIVENEATIIPGNVGDVTALFFTDLSITSATFAPIIESNTDYDALVVQNMVTLNDANLAPIGGYTVQEGDELVIITNNGSSPVSGTFNNLPEGAEVTFGDFDGIISYAGGDGNDVVLKYNRFKDAFITTWKTDNSGASADDQISIFTDNSLTYDFDIDWGDGNVQIGVTENTSHTYDMAGTYTIRIKGLFPRFISGGDAEKLISIDAWGANIWSSFDSAFADCENMDLLATDIPDLSNVISMFNMFGNCHAFLGNPSINNWDVSSIENMQLLFLSATSFNQPLDNWNVSNVTTMSSMFNGAESFNQDLNSWNTSQVQFMDFMFLDASDFNGAIGNWIVGNVVEMSYMFNRAEDFNQDLNNWNVSQVQEMDFMFLEATNFNGDISNWNPAQVTTMNAMFQNAVNFNRDISGWNVNQVTDMGFMFNGATLFNQPIGHWDVSNVQSADDMLIGTAFSSGNYDDLLISWNQLTLQDNVNFGTDAGLCLGESAQQNIITNHNWSFTDGGVDCGDAFITKWQTTAMNESITIPTAVALGTTYDYSVDWGDGTITYNITGDATHTYTNTGVYTVKIYGDFPQLYFNNGGDRLKLVDIEQWGDIAWGSMERAFFGCENLIISAIDSPNLSNVTTMEMMLRKAGDDIDINLWADITNWDVSHVEDMSSLFRESKFNQNISTWIVDNVLDMKRMFQGNTAFNQNIASWNVGNVTNMFSMFLSANSFNQDISGWDVSQVRNMRDMFRNATNFDRNLGAWDISSLQSPTMQGMLFNTALSTENYDNTLIGWSTLDAGEFQIPINVNFNAGTSQYCVSEFKRQELITNFGWTITDAGKVSDCVNPDSFITLWETTLANQRISLGTGADYAVNWGDGTIEVGLSGNAIHEYTSPGTYTVSIVGDFGTISLNPELIDVSALQEVQQWGSITWDFLAGAFFQCSNLDVTASDVPDLSNISDLGGMFLQCTSLIGNDTFNQWDVSNIESMEAMFWEATSFNQPLDQWNMENVTSMRDMFYGATSFDQNIGSWDISSLTDAQDMFFNAGLATDNYDNTLIGWATLDTSAGESAIPMSVNFHAGNSQYCLSETQRQDLMDTYGWSITDGDLDPTCPTDVLIAPKVYLQGASINPIGGEESLMRDDLRVNGLFPLSTPYGDGLTIDASVLATSGPDAIVDWIWVELRNQTDSSIIIDSQSALLQRDGDVVGLDGISPLAFDQPEDRYYVVINHRNHIGVITAAPQTLSTTTSLVDLTADPAAVEGGANSVILLSNGFYGMYTGDFDSNAQIQNTDANAVIQLIGGAGYEDADMDINTQIQNTDVNVLINPNIGRGEQFSRPEISAELLSTDVTLAFANAQITNDGVDDYYEADIMISGTTDFYIGSGQVYLEYNATAFGENVATNNTIEYSQPDGTILGYSFGAFSPAYRDFVQNDNTTSRVSLSFQQNIGLAGLETAPELEITATPKVLFHIKIRYVDSSADANICFYTDGVFQDQFFTACGGTATADCTITPGVQITNDSYDCSEAGVDTLGITSLETEQILLYPNPTSSSFRIKGLTTTSKISIYDVNGRLILEEQRSDDREIDMSRYDNGVYLVEISTEQGIQIKRLIKK